MVRIQKVQSVNALTGSFCLANLVWLVCIALLSAGCAQTYAKREVTFRNVAIEQAPFEIPEERLLDVHIKSFDPGAVSEDDDKGRGLSNDIRHAEGYYMAINVRDAMQRSGYWGAVRVVPEIDSGTELQVSGKILESDGEILKLEVTVTDARGVHWFTHHYDGVIDEAKYSGSDENRTEPFQFIFREISNDIALHRGKFTKEELASIRTVAELKFARDFAPDAFGDYLANTASLGKAGDVSEKKESNFFSDFIQKVSTTKDTENTEETPKYYRINRIPAAEDPMLQRVRRVRVRNNQVIDALDQQYGNLARNIQTAYFQWRQSRLSEMNSIRELEEKRNEETGKAVGLAIAGIIAGAVISSQCRDCGSVGGAVAGSATSAALQLALKANEQASEDAKIHKAALEELGQSLAADVKPTIIDVEGQTVELKGTAEAKFAQWRQVIKKLYEREVGPEKLIANTTKESSVSQK